MGVVPAVRSAASCKVHIRLVLRLTDSFKWNILVSDTVADISRKTSVG